MKKVLFAVVAGLLIASSSHAASVVVSPEVNAVFTKGYRTSVQEGVEFSVSQLPSVLGVEIPKSLSVNSGLLISDTEVKGTSDNFVQYTIPLTLGYEVAVTKNVTVTPFGGFNFIVNDTDHLDDTFGEVVGARVNYTINSNWSASAQAGLLFSDTDKSTGTTVSGNGGFVGGVLSYRV